MGGPNGGRARPGSPLPAHIHAPLPTHPDFEHDPHLPEHVESSAARRLRFTLEPLLSHQLEVPPTDASKHDGEPVLDRVKFRALKLAGKTQLSHNAARYRFALPHREDSLGLPVGQHVWLAADINGKRVMRSYTPTSLDSELGYFDLVVKTYPNGLLSTHIAHLRIGDAMLVRGPKGKFAYTRTLAPHLLMIAGGSGITPMYRIIKSSVLDPADKTVLRLLYANVEEEDILLRKELDYLVSQSHGRLKVQYVLEKPPSNWTGPVGCVTPALVEANLPPGGAKSGGKVLLCGPPGMIGAMKKTLVGFGYPAPHPGSDLEDQVFLF